MSTNYYFRVRKPEPETNIYLKKLHDSIVHEIGGKLHIGKRSKGWLPLYHSTKYYRSVDEIKRFYKVNKFHLIIENEYGDILTLNELEEELFNWKDKYNIMSHYTYTDISTDDDGNEFTPRCFL